MDYGIGVLLAVPYILMWLMGFAAWRKLRQRMDYARVTRARIRAISA